MELYSWSKEKGLEVVQDTRQNRLWASFEKGRFCRVRGFQWRRSCGRWARATQCPRQVRKWRLLLTE